LIDYYENPDHGFVFEIQTGSLIYKFQAKLPEYVAAKEFVTESNIGNKLKERCKQLDSSVWFNIKIQTLGSTTNPLKFGITSYSEYQERLNYFLMTAKDNFELEYKNKGSVPIAYFFENSYGAMPYETMIVGFKLADNLYDDDVLLKYKDEIFHSGLLKIAITKRDLINKPILNL
jgi:hypothetical protein